MASTKGVCEGCVLGKHHKEMYDKGKTSRANEQLQLINSDICGPIETPSFSHATYFLTFINDYSRKSWVYFLKHKNETSGIFQDCKSMVENESIKVLGH